MSVNGKSEERVRRNGVVKKSFLAAFPKTIPIMTGFLFLGMSYGIYMKVSGFSFVYPLCMSMVIFGGSLEFVAVTMLLGSFAPLQTFLMALMIQARHLFYGISLVEKYKGMGKIKPYLIFGLTDETYSLVCNTSDEIDHKDRKLYFGLVTLMDHCYWITGCTLGAILGGLIKFSTEGIDFVLTALFVSILVDQWLNTKQHIPALTGAAATALCLAIFGPDNFLIPSMIVITAMLLGLRKKVE